MATGSGTGTEITTTTYAETADIAAYSDPFTVPAEWTTSKLAAAILDASAIIDNVTRTHFGVKSKELLLSGTGTGILRTNKRTVLPIVSITQVQTRTAYDADDNFDDDGEVVNSDYYRISNSRHALVRIRSLTMRSGLMLQQPIWIRGDHNYKVTGTFGRANVPKDIKLATIWLVREQIIPGYISEKEQPIQEMFPDGYMYILFRERSMSETELLPLTGYRMIDTLLRHHVNRTPLMVAITNRGDVATAAVRNSLYQ